MRSNLVTDVHPIDQPAESYRYALNAVPESEAGDMGRISTERGTTLCTTLPGQIVGEVYMSNGQTCVFLDSNQIGVVEECEYTPIYQDPSLNFNVNNVVDGTFRLRNGCERTVYFTDGVNSPKVIDLDNAEVDPLTPEYTHANITVAPIRGGTLEVGAYFVAVQYLDDSLNPTPFYSNVGPTVLVEGQTGGRYSKITGNFTDEVDPINGAVTSGKGLVVSFNQADTRFSYFRLAIGVATSGVGSVQQVFLSPQIPITSPSYAVTSFSGWTTTTPQDVAVDPEVIGTAQHIEQIENRLVLSNVATPKRDWEELLQNTLQITTQWGRDTVPTKTYVPQGDKYHNQTLKGYMGGDAYVFGIVYIFQNGSESPVFLVPPSAPTAFDTELLTVVSTGATGSQVNLDDVRHIGGQLGDEIPRWKVFNTSGNNINKFGYYEGESVYPSTTGCDGQTPLWGDLAGQPVRYHVFPNQTNLHNGSRSVRHLNITFNNITYPAGVVGHFFVRARKQLNLVEGTGYTYGLSRQFQDDGQLSTVVATTEPNVTGNTADFLNLINPELFHNLNLSFGHIKTVSAIAPSFVQNTSTVDVGGADGDDIVVDLNVDYRYARLDEVHELDVEVNRIVDRTYALPFGRDFLNIDAINFGNRTLNNGSWVVRLEDNLTFTNPDHFKYVQLRNSADPYPNYASLEYTRISPNFGSAGDDFKCFGGDTFIAEFNLNYTERFEGGGDAYTLEGVLYGPMYFETRINPALSIRRSDRCFYRFDPSLEHLGSLQPGNVAEGVAFLVNNSLKDDLTISTEQCQDTYTVNPDLHSQDRLRFYNTLPSTFNYCASCLGEHKNRVVYSQQGFQEELADNYRVFLANNYKDLEGETGAITDLARYNNILYVFTEDAIWYQPASVQERASSTGLISYVGTGEFLSLPEQQITNYDRIGKINKWSTNVTPYGIVTVDTTNGAVYLLTKSIENITQGVSRELRDGMGNSLEEFVDYPHSYMYGAVTAYDEEYDRILVTYKDYVPKVWGGVVESADDILDTVFYDGQFFVNLREFGRINIQLGDPRYFTNRSFTISRSFKTGWVGYHSYTPNVYLYGESSLYSIENNRLWEHNTGNFLVYYGIKYSHIVEPVFVSSRTSVWDSIDFTTEATRNGRHVRWETFDQILAYNSYQSTNLQPLTAKNSIEGQDYLVDVLDEGYFVDELDEVWHVNGLRDLVSNYEVPLTIDSEDLRVTDKVPNVLAFTGKEWFETEPLRDQYLITRLVYNGGDKLTTLITKENGRNRG